MDRHYALRFEWRKREANYYAAALENPNLDTKTAEVDTPYLSEDDTVESSSSDARMNGNAGVGGRRVALLSDRIAYVTRWA